MIIINATQILNIVYKYILLLKNELTLMLFLEYQYDDKGLQEKQLPINNATTKS